MNKKIMKNQIFKLEKPLSGLQKVPFIWNQEFTKFLTSRRLMQTVSDCCLYKTKDCSMILAIFINDGFLTG